MTSKDLMKKLVSLLAKDKLEKLISILQQLLKNSSKLDEVIVQSSRYNDVMRQIRLGIISTQDANIEKNKIRFALIDMVRTLELEMDKSVEIEKEIERSYSIWSFPKKLDR